MFNTCILKREMYVFERCNKGTVDPNMMLEDFFPTPCKRDFFRILLYRRDTNVFNNKILTLVPEFEGKANVK